jgi:hypothetical protein
MNQWWAVVMLLSGGLAGRELGASDEFSYQQPRRVDASRRTQQSRLLGRRLAEVRATRHRVFALPEGLVR